MITFKKKSLGNSHSSSRFFNEEDGCILSCPGGAQVGCQCRVTTLM